ncbi:MAG: glycogen-binding domain-containing protein [Candidatus Krumholzibacteria bacterium]|nr:glycogen-binding domain-containing protein [Candidatus Krumholzibacteria bacterium]
MSLARVAAAALLLSAFMQAVPDPVRSAVELDEEEVVFTLEFPGAQKVFLAGDFNAWNPTMDRMEQDGGNFEIRLYLVPGKYRYMFIVDGEQIADPDNPWRDEEGKTFFIFRRKDDGYEIAYSGGIERGRSVESAEAALGLKGFAGGDEDNSSIFLEPELTVDVDGNIRAEISPGFEYRSGEEGPDFRIVRAEASYTAERGGIRAFSRAGGLDLGDPLSLFGKAGPFGYEAGTFSRGVAVRGDILFGLKGSVFFADRLEGYRSGFETCADSSCVAAEGLLAGVDPADGDCIGLKASYASGRAAFEYYYRRDSGPGGRRWSSPDDPGWIYTGYRSKDIHGGTLRVSVPCSTTVEVEYLDGRTRLSSTERFSTVPGEVPPEFDADWESGRRIHAGIRSVLGNVDAAFAWQRTTIEGDPLLRMGRSSDMRTTVELDLGYETDSFRAGLIGIADRFHKDGAAAIFWFQRYNFWLDGDDIEAGRLPFLDARGLYLLSFSLEEKDERLSGPYPMGGIFSISLRSDIYEKNRRMLQMSLARGFGLGKALSLHFDVRHVSYDPGGKEERFDCIDVWAGLCGRINDRGWVSVGAGLSPYSFDRWLFGVTGYGREKYLLERVIPEINGGGSIDRVTDAIRRYEKDLSEEWTVSFQAGILF